MQVNGAMRCEQRFLNRLMADGGAGDALKMFDFADAAAAPAQQVGNALAALMRGAGNVTEQRMKALLNKD